MPTKGTRVVSARISTAESERLRIIASDAGISVSAWIYKVVHDAIIAAPPESRWKKQWAKIQELGGLDAADAFNRLRGGRKLPVGFLEWSKRDKISWLDRHWPI